MRESIWDVWGSTIVNVAAVLIAAAIAVWGSIRGANEGAKQGAEATLAATRQAINAEQEAAREQRRRETRTAIRALATECRLNARTLREPRKYLPDPRFLAPLRNSALDTATAEISTLPETVQRDAIAVFEDVLWFNRLVSTRIAALTADGEGVAHAHLSELEELGKNLPGQLDDVAGKLEAQADSA